MKRWLFAALGAILSLVSGIFLLPGVASAQVTKIPDLGLSFAAPKGFQASERLSQAVNERYKANPAFGMSLRAAYVAPRWYYPSLISVMVSPCPDEPLPDTVAPRIIQGILHADPSMKLTAEGWSTVGGERAYVVRMSMTVTKPGAAPISLGNSFALIARHGKMIMFVFACRADNYTRDIPAFSGMLKSVTWEK